MHRFTLILLIGTLFTLQSLAQLNGGIKGGINITDLIVTSGEDYFGDAAFESKTTYHFGSYVKNTFSDHFGYQIEMLFSNKGYRLKTDSITTNVSLNYLNWPLLMVYNLSDKFAFHAGIELGLMVTGEDLYNTFDLGIDIGAEYDLSQKLLVGIRYNHGLPFTMNIDSYDNASAEPRYQHSVLQFYLGFNIVNEPATE